MRAFTSIKQCLLLLCLLILVIASQAKTHVYITNGIGGNLDLTVHCKSKNDDLGVRLLHFNEIFEFSFKPNIWGTTLFYCSFAWPGSGPLKWFDVYDDSSLAYRCRNCHWSIKSDGPCLLHDGGNDQCFTWE